MLRDASNSSTWRRPDRTPLASFPCGTTSLPATRERQDAQRRRRADLGSADDGPRSPSASGTNRSSTWPSRRGRVCADLPVRRGRTCGPGPRRGARGAIRTSSGTAGASSARAYHGSEDIAESRHEAVEPSAGTRGRGCTGVRRADVRPFGERSSVGDRRRACDPPGPPTSPWPCTSRGQQRPPRRGTRRPAAWTTMAPRLRDRRFGVLHDPLGRPLAALADSRGGRGLWLINHLCDLVQIRSTAVGNGDTAATSDSPTP